VNIEFTTKMAALSQTLNIYPSTTRLQFSFPNSKLNQPRFSSFSIRTSRFQPIFCSSSNVQPKKHSPSSSTKNKNKNLTNNNNNDKKKKKNNNKKSNVEISDSNSTSTSKSSLPPHVPTPLPKPPAGFIVDDTGKLLSSSNDQLATLVSFISCYSVIQLTCVSTFKYQIHQLFNESEK
jgi:hypothetical protein